MQRHDAGRLGGRTGYRHHQLLATTVERFYRFTHLRRRAVELSGYITAASRGALLSIASAARCRADDELPFMQEAARALIFRLILLASSRATFRAMPLTKWLSPPRLIPSGASSAFRRFCLLFRTPKNILLNMLAHYGAHSALWPMTRRPPTSALGATYGYRSALSRYRHA